MKIFPENFFTPEELGRWAFGGLLLATLGSWSVAAWMTLGGWLVDFSKGVEISPVFTVIFILFVLIGVNRKNDQGLKSRRKSNWDDIRVMIRL